MRYFLGLKWALSSLSVGWSRGLATSCQTSAMLCGCMTSSLLAIRWCPSTLLLWWVPYNQKSHSGKPVWLSFEAWELADEVRSEQSYHTPTWQCHNSPETFLFWFISQGQLAQKDSGRKVLWFSTVWSCLQVCVKHSHMLRSCSPVLCIVHVRIKAAMHIQHSSLSHFVSMDVLCPALCKNT